MTPGITETSASRHARLARIATSLFGMSFILPLIAFFVFSSPDSGSLLWIGSAVVVLLAIAAGFSLGRLEKQRFSRPLTAWCVVAAYFSVMLAILWTSCGPRPEIFWLVGPADMGGLALCLEGIIRSLVNRP